MSYPDQVEITDTAVYFSDTPKSSTPIYRRSLTTDASGTALGDAEVVGVALEYSVFAEHEGTLAYSRGVDGRLVLRAPDGTTTMPAWGRSPDFAGGVHTLTDEWVLATDDTGDLRSVRLYDRGDGRSYGLDDLTVIPAGYDWLGAFSVIVTDDRMLWTLSAHADFGRTIEKVLTVALGPDGPAGPVVELESATNVFSAGATFTWFDVLDIEGTRVMWTRTDYENSSGASTRTVRWDDEVPAAEPTHALEITDHPVAVEGDVLTMIRGDAAVGTVTWIDLAAPATPVRTVDTRPWVRDILGPYVTHSTDSGQVAFSDASGGPVTITSAPVPTLGFIDVDWSDPFITEVRWLAGQGITTGWPDGSFRPTASIERQAMAAFLRRMVQSGDAPSCSSAAFDDVPPGHPFCSDITWLAGTGITTGWPDGTYRGAEPVSREAMAAFLYRLANDGADAPACAAKPFADVAVGNPFCGEIAWLASTGVTTGWSDGTFRPGLSIDRQAMAAFLYRFSDAGLVPAG